MMTLARILAALAMIGLYSAFNGGLGQFLLLSAALVIGYCVAEVAK